MRSRTARVRPRRGDASFDAESARRRMRQTREKKSNGTGKEAMSGFCFKQRVFFGLLTGVAVVAALGWGVWANCRGCARAAQEIEYAFGGWKYGREDQKAANAALVAAGFNDFQWDSGKLVVPPNKKAEYQKVLASANAYPKAPSETRRDALREMSAFESDAKTRMRELDACAFQLERTIEQMAGVEYATVGVRARREQVGLTAKNVVTASVGVACKDGCSLDPNALSAITVATKHQLGVENAENISILDLKEGVSYFGTETSVGNANELGLAREKERIENYWRAKLLDAFGYMKGVRASVVVELAPVRAEERAFERLGRTERDERKQVERTANASRSSAKVRTASYEARRTTGRAGEDSRSARKAENSAETKRTKTFASLGNPDAARFQTVASTAEQNWARLGTPADGSRSRERRFGDCGDLTAAVEGRERNGGRVVLSSYLEKNSDESNAPNDSDESSDSKKNAGSTADVAPELDEAEADVALEGAFERPNDASGARVLRGSKGSEVDGLGGLGGGTDYRVRSLSVAISAPSGYVWRVARTLTRRIDETGGESGGDFNDIYRETERNVVDETKRVAAALLRPLAGAAGWTVDETLAAIDVAVYSDCDDAPTTFGARRPKSLNDGGRASGFSRAADRSADVDFSGFNGEINAEIGGNDNFGDLDGTNESPANGNGLSNDVRVAPTSAKVAERSIVDRDNADSSERPFGKGGVFGGEISLFGRTFNLGSAANEPIVWGVASVLVGLCVFGVAIRSGRKRRERRAAARLENVGAADEPESKYSAKRDDSNASSNAERSGRATGEIDDAFGAADEADSIEIATVRSKFRPATSAADVGRAQNGDDERSKRREAADIIAKNPELAAAALRNWIKSDV